MSNLMRSSELERGERGRCFALSLRDSAQAALEAACNAQSVDFTLAEASIVRTESYLFHTIEVTDC